MIFLADGFTKEERKLEDETKKILNSPNMKISATAVRVPVVIGHSESVHLEMTSSFDLTEVKGSLRGDAGHLSRR